MRFYFRHLAALAAVAALSACADTGVPTQTISPMAPRASGALPPTGPRLSEIHYDNTGADAGEFIEVEAPLGTDLTTYSIVLYNGNGGAVYDTKVLNATNATFTTCSDRVLAVVNYSAAGGGSVQNGSPDGMALVNGSTLVEFLSYEGTFAGVGGAANGVTSTDIGAIENGSGPLAGSLERQGAGTTFTLLAQNTKGVCPTVANPNTPIVAVSASPSSVALGATTTLSASVTQNGAAVTPTSITWSASPANVLSFASTDGASVSATGAAGGTTTVTASAVVDGTTYTGTVQVTVNAPIVTVTPSPSTIAIGGNSTVSAVLAVGGVPVTPTSITWSALPSDVASLSGTTGASITATGASLGTTTLTAVAVYNGVSYTGTATLNVATLTIAWIDLSSSTSSFPAGFQTQLFATARVSSGGTIIPATFVFESLSPDIATVQTVQGTGIVTGVSGSATKPSIRVTATPVGGGTPYSFTSTPVTIETDLLASPSIYGDNTALGTPTAASSSNPDDFLIQRTQYTLSYNQSRGTPNWVSYELDARQMLTGGDRCNCFTADPLLPANKQILTSDYTNGGYDRGHMARSADRIVTNGENARTFYLTNIVPQLADLNQGVWATFENQLADSARSGGKAVYIATGPKYNAGQPLSYIKNEGKIAIPDSTWKVALIVKRDVNGVPYNVSNLQSWANIDSVTLLAVMMPNISGIRGDAPSKYFRTVDQIEASTGLDMMNLLVDAYENALEAGDHAPVAVIGGATSGNEGQSLGFTAAASGDPDLAVAGFNEVLSYAWSFGDGSNSTGIAPSKTFANNGSYTVKLTVTDKFGWPREAVRTLVIDNVAPTVSILPPTADWIAGVSGNLKLTFTDPNPKDAAFVIRVNWGDGTPVSTLNSLVLPAAPISRPHVYAAPGTYTVTVTVTDRDGSVGTSTIQLLVSSPAN